jgi:hypothetical protein
MYETSSVLTEPTRSSQQLWRYYAPERLLDLLRTEELFFTHLPAFSDGLEGSLTARSRERLLRWFSAQGCRAQIAREKVLEYESEQRAFFVSCWHMNDSESYLMWKAYADRGVAVRTTLERMKAAFEVSPCVITGGVVTYVDFERNFTPLGNIFNHVVTKDLPYRDEREFRALVWQHDAGNKGLNPVSRGLRVRVNLGMLVECVIENPITKAVPDELRVLLEQRGIECVASLINHRVTINPDQA